MHHLLTKTFVENRWYRRLAPQQWEQLAGDAELSLDEQVRAWVIETGAELIHPGQLGMHTAWHEEQQVKCVTLGLTVLYKERSHALSSPQPPRTAGW